jgi:hypothetical protein
VKGIWRAIVFWRYLLLACLVVATSFGYVLVPQMRLPWHDNTGQMPPVPSLRGKYQQLKDNMTGPQAIEILGPPQEVKRVCDINEWHWYQGQESIIVEVIAGDPPLVLFKHFRGPPERDRPD